MTSGLFAAVARETAALKASWVLRVHRFGSIAMATVYHDHNRTTADGSRCSTLPDRVARGGRPGLGGCRRRGDQGPMTAGPGADWRASPRGRCYLRRRAGCWRSRHRRPCLAPSRRTRTEVHRRRGTHLPDPCARRAAGDRRHRGALLPPGLRVGGRRLPRRRSVLRPERLPHRRQAPRRAPGHGPHRPRGLLERALPPAAAGPAVRDGGRGRLRPVLRRAAHPSRHPHRQLRGARLRGQLALHPRRRGLLRRHGRPVSGPPPLVALGRGAVLRAVPAAAAGHGLVGCARRHLPTGAALVGGPGGGVHRLDGVSGLARRRGHPPLRGHRHPSGHHPRGRAGGRGGPRLAPAADPASAGSSCAAGVAAPRWPWGSRWWRGAIRGGCTRWVSSPSPWRWPW